MPLSVALEATVQMFAGYTNCERFRRFEHRLFGLTEAEWEALETIFLMRELGNLTIQQSAWLEQECCRIEQLLMEQDTSSEDQEPADIPELRSEFYRLCQERGKAQDIMGKVWARYGAGVAKIKHTPTGRAQSGPRPRLRKKKDSPRWATSRCIEAGGCCARSCQCCFKLRHSNPRVNIFKWAHCTPACSCCLQFMGVDKPIGLPTESRKLPFDIRSRDPDSLGAKKMDSGIWGLI